MALDAIMFGNRMRDEESERCDVERKKEKKLWKNRLLLYLAWCPRLMRLRQRQLVTDFDSTAWMRSPHLTLAPHLRKFLTDDETHLCVFYSVCNSTKSLHTCNLIFHVEKRKDISFRLLCSFTLRARKSVDLEITTRTGIEWIQMEEYFPRVLFLHDKSHSLLVSTFGSICCMERINGWQCEEEIIKRKKIRNVQLNKSFLIRSFKRSINHLVECFEIIVCSHLTVSVC